MRILLLSLVTGINILTHNWASVKGQASCPSYGIVYSFDTSPGSSDIYSFPFSGFDQCCQACQNNPSCAAWVYNNPAFPVPSQCFLKSAIAPRVFTQVVGKRLYTGLPIRDSIPFSNCPGVTKGLDIAPGSENDLAAISNSNLGSCCTACASHPLCQGFSFNPNNQMCWLKKTDTPWVVASSPSYISGLTFTSCTPRIKNYDIAPNSGHDIAVINFLNEDLDCCNACRHNLNCKSWVFNVISFACYLKDTVGPWVRAPSYLSAGLATNQIHSPFGCQVVPGLNIAPGSQNDLSVNPNYTLQGCCTLCKANSLCKGFVFNLDNKNCWLKKVDTPWVEDSSVTLSGLPSST